VIAYILAAVFIVGAGTYALKGVIDSERADAAAARARTARLGEDARRARQSRKGLPVIQFFGRHWDAPMLDEGAVQIPVPIGASCMHCDELITGADRGLMRALVSYDRTGDLVAASRPAHMECDLRSGLGSIAHLRGECLCSSQAEQFYPGTIRDEARAVLEYLNTERSLAGLGPL
jgi:hypothetical protein